jgi:hypothetical protein
MVLSPRCNTFKIACSLNSGVYILLPLYVFGGDNYSYTGGEQVNFNNGGGSNDSKGNSNVVRLVRGGQ